VWVFEFFVWIKNISAWEASGKPKNSYHPQIHHPSQRRILVDVQASLLVELWPWIDTVATNLIFMG
jgi:hypothetical protein